MTFKYLKRYDCYNYLYSKEGIAAERLKSLNIDYSLNKDIGSHNPFKIYKLLKEINTIVNDKKINILHSYSRATEILCWLYKKYYDKDIKTVNTVLSLVKNKYFVEYKSDKLIAISKCVKTQLTDKFKIPEGKINLIYNYAEPYESNGNKQNSNKGSFNILSVGRFHKEKNFETLLRALHYLKRREIKLTLVGSGVLEESYLKYIKGKKLNVIILQPKNNLLPYFLECDICVLPSLVDPLPTFMIQSGFFKRPFIGSNVDGISETIIDGYNGLLFNKGNYIELSEKILEYYDNHRLMKNCADNLYTLMSSKHNPEINVSNIYDLYESLIYE